MKSLIIDTSATKLLVALIFDNEIKFKCLKDNSTNLSVELLPLIDDCLKKNNLEIKDIDKIFITNGPGSFTGIRIGLAVVKTIGWSLNIPIIPISSLEVMASGCNEDKIVPLIPARNGNVYAGIYDSNLNCIQDDCFINLEDIMKKYPNYYYVSYDKELNVNEAKLDLIKLVNKYKNVTGVNPHTLKPNYLKLTEAERNLRIKNND